MPYPQNACQADFPVNVSFFVTTKLTAGAKTAAILQKDYTI